MPDEEVQPSADAVAAAASAAPVAFAKRKNRGNIRKRADPDADADPDSTVVQKAKQQRGGPLAFTTKKDELEAVALRYESNKALPAQVDDTATRALETETAYDRDARALREQKLQQAEGEAAQGDGKYHGMNSYTDFRAGFKREKTIASEKGSGAHGPLRGNSYVRSSARFDYQPDLCKDYKETGFCSYGDSCKFLHDRGDYKSGWELEREWDSQQKAKMEKRMEAMLKGWNPDDGDEPPEEEEEDEDDELPFACYICRRPWPECPSEPVVTRCRHYFCQTCALKHNSKTGKCAACDSATQGIFNIASDIQKRMKDKKPTAAT